VPRDVIAAIVILLLGYIREYTISVTVLLEYLNRAFSFCGCLLFYNLLIFLLSFGRDDLLCLIHLHSNFQLIPPCCLCVILAETLDFFYLRKIDCTILPRLG